MPVGHFDVFFEKMSLRIFSPFFIRIFFFAIEFLHILDISPLDNTICKYFSLFCRLPFILLMVSFTVSEALNLV